MKNPGMAVWMTVLTLAVAAPAFPQQVNQQGQGHAIVTVLPKHEGAAPASVANQDLSVKVNGKMAKVTSWTPLRESANPMELVLLIDGSARTSLGLQMGEIKHFINSLPPNTKAAIAYMQNGSAVFAAPLSADHAQVLRTLHLPSEPAGSSASPYFCLSDLAKHWPSKDETARRVVVMITDGVDYYEMRYDPEDPYVQTAINDSVRARLVVYSIYCENRGRAGSSMYENFAGQNLLQEVSEATGGESYWQGMGNPVSYEPYFNEMTRRFRNQYELGFTSPLEGKPRIESLKLTLSAPGNEVDTPQKVLVVPMEN
jgi:hypothetical protein